jgi:hypothetical protein
VNRFRKVGVYEKQEFVKGLSKEDGIFICFDMWVRKNVTENIKDNNKTELEMKMKMQI